MAFFRWLGKALSDGEFPSSMRLYNFIAVVVFVPVLAWGFIWVCLHFQQLEGLIIAFAGIISALIAGVLGIQTLNKKVGLNEKDPG